MLFYEESTHYPFFSPFSCSSIAAYKELLPGLISTILCSSTEIAKGGRPYTLIAISRTVNSEQLMMGKHRD